MSVGAGAAKAMCASQTASFPRFPTRLHLMRARGSGCSAQRELGVVCNSRRRLRRAWQVSGGGPARPAQTVHLGRQGRGCWLQVKRQRRSVTLECRDQCRERRIGRCPLPERAWCCTWPAPRFCSTGRSQAGPPRRPVLAARAQPLLAAILHFVEWMVRRGNPG